MIVGAPQQPGAAGEVKLNPKLQGMFDQAIQQRKTMPVSMNINKLYRNQEERIQDEMNQAKADALRKSLLGGNFKTMLANNGQLPGASPTATAGNPFAKLFGGLGSKLGGAAANNTMGPTPMNPIMTQSMALPHGGPKPPQRNASQQFA